MKVNAKFLEVTEIRDVNFVKDGIQKTMKAYSYLIQWSIFVGEHGQQRSQELVVEALYDADKTPQLLVGKIADETTYEMSIYFHANRTKDGRVFNSVRLAKFSPANENNYGDD